MSLSVKAASTDCSSALVCVACVNVGAVTLGKPLEGLFKPQMHLPKELKTFLLQKI